ncbi:MAG: Gfo/Idh/MocA family oxidoreductase [Azospirillaceae bacterium]
MRKLKWGILSTADIGVRKVIPPMQQATACDIVAIASRDAKRAEEVAGRLGIPRHHGDYDALLADPEVEAIYNPLPNHLHVPWTEKAAAAGKHVLCEKPIALDAEEARRLIDARDRHGVVIQEAFMVRTHPQWLKVRGLVESGAIGELRAIQGFFSYDNTNPDDIRNQADIGGGGLYDIGCYPITTSRFVTGREPESVVATLDRDPEMRIDRLGSAILQFGRADGYPVQATFTYSTQIVPYQRMQFFGTTGRIEVEIPFNAPNDRPCRLFVDDGSSVTGDGTRIVEIEQCDQYGVAGDAFSRAVLDGTPPPVPLENSVANMRVIDACFRSADSGRWVSL